MKSPECPLSRANFAAITSTSYFLRLSRVWRRRTTSWLCLRWKAAIQTFGSRHWKTSRNSYLPCLQVRLLVVLTDIPVSRLVSIVQSFVIDLIKLKTLVRRKKVFFHKLEHFWHRWAHAIASNALSSSRPFTWKSSIFLKKSAYLTKHSICMMGCNDAPTKSPRHNRLLPDITPPRRNPSWQNPPEDPPKILNLWLMLVTDRNWFTVVAG